MRSTNSRMSSPPAEPAPAIGRGPAAELAVRLGGPLGRRAVPLRVADLLQPHVDRPRRGRAPRARALPSGGPAAAATRGPRRTPGRSSPSANARAWRSTELGQRRVDDVEPVAHPFRLGVTDQHQLHRGERTSTVLRVSGWYPDPTGRFEYRYHNDQVWTADVASAGQRFVDPLPTVRTGARRTRAAGRQRPGRRRDGLRHRRRRHAVGPVRRRARADHRRSSGWRCRSPALARRGRPGSRRGFAIAGIVTSACGLLAGAVGIVLTVVAGAGRRALRGPRPARRPPDRLHARATAARSSPAARSRTVGDDEQTYSVLVAPRRPTPATRCSSRTSRRAPRSSSRPATVSAASTPTTTRAAGSCPSTVPRRSASTPTSSSELRPGARIRRSARANPAQCGRGQGVARPLVVAAIHAS